MLLMSRHILRVLLILAWVAAAAFAALLALFAIGPDALLATLDRGLGAEAAAARDAMMAILAIGIAATPPVHIVFTRLIAMIDTVRAGQPFAPANAERLRQIAWGVLAIQLLDLAFGWIAWRLGEAADEPLGWQLSITGWLAVLLLFVLAGVFRQGAAMQDEIEGTV